MSHGPDPAQMSRRVFVGASPLILAGLAACSRAFVEHAHLAESFIVDPQWSAYRPVLQGLLRVILPLDDPAFPRLPIERIEQRLTSMFPIEKERRFLGLQRTLTLFDHTELFPLTSGPLLLEEEKARDIRGRGADRDWVNALRKHEERAYAEFVHRNDLSGPATFAALHPAAQRQYFELWRDSASIVKRAFASSIKSLVMMTVYSSEEAWAAIGYEGPLIDRPERPR